MRFFILLIYTISLSANTFQCTIDTVKYLDSGKFQSIPKGQREKVTINLKKNILILTIAQKQNFKLIYRGSKKLMNIINTDIYSDDNIQLEIIDISESWKTGARLFIGNRMFMIGTCKH